MIENVTGSLVEFMNLIRDNEIMKYIYKWNQYNEYEKYK